MKIQSLILLIFFTISTCACGRPNQGEKSPQRQPGMMSTIASKTKTSFNVMKAASVSGISYLSSKIHTPKQASAGSEDLAEYRTRPEAYKAMPKSENTSLVNGLQGVVKVFAEHEIYGQHKGKSISGSGRFQGAGSVILVDREMFVVTAKHIVVPNKDTKSITSVDAKGHKSTIEFDKVTSVAAKVVVGPLAVVPESIWLSKDYDAAVLQIAQKDQKAILDGYFHDSAAPIGILPDLAIVKPGYDVESWGFPAKQNPQVEKNTVASTDVAYFVLNRALIRGYSGGPVLVQTGNTKRIGGIIYRADEQSNQTYVLSWKIVSQLLDAAKSNHNPSDATHVELGGDTTLDGVPYKYVPYYVFKS
jgi:hypothetical protein